MSSRPVWIVPAGWSHSFERNRFLIQVFFVGPLSAACAAWGHALWMLVVFFVGFWPFPYRARWTAEGLEVSWLFVRECLSVEHFASARLCAGFRYLWLFRYELALEIELAGGRHAVILASPRTLRTFYSEITTALAMKAPPAAQRAGERTAPRC